ncbi:MAG: helix-turn-helix transcriptional regulator [Caldilineaceae bacterium]|nr:helix-turn-helix transcriptional regulator [Caldilineaceae bacterium]
MRSNKRHHEHGRHSVEDNETRHELGQRRHGHGQRGGGGGRGGGRGRRAQRGDARLIVLDALRDGAKHGYEIIKSLEERSAGQYVPSPGTVYPTLQFLEDQGLVSAQPEGERRVYQITEAGLAELEAQTEQITAFWERFAGEGAASETHHEVRFLQDELEHLNRIVWNELRPSIAQGRQDTVRQVRSAVESCQQQVRQIIATGVGGES